MLCTDLRTGIVSCNGKSWKLSPGQHQMLKWIIDEVMIHNLYSGLYWVTGDNPYRMTPGNYMNYLSELVYKGMEGEV